MLPDWPSRGSKLIPISATQLVASLFTRARQTARCESALVSISQHYFDSIMSLKELNGDGWDGTGETWVVSTITNQGSLLPDTYFSGFRQVVGGCGSWGVVPMQVFKLQLKTTTVESLVVLVQHVQPADAGFTLALNFLGILMTGFFPLWNSGSSWSPSSLSAGAMNELSDGLAASAAKVSCEKAKEALGSRPGIRP